MFLLYSGHCVTGGYDGFSGSESYYIRAEDFLPVIEGLKAEESAVIKADGFQVIERSSWDHSYSSPDDEGYASIQGGSISGGLRLEKDIFTEYDLNFSPRGVKKELKSDTGSISNQEIRAVISGKE